MSARNDSAIRGAREATLAQSSKEFGVTVEMLNSLTRFLDSAGSLGYGRPALPEKPR